MLLCVKQLTRVLPDEPSWTRARLKLMAHSMQTLPIQTTNLAELLLVIKP